MKKALFVRKKKEAEVRGRVIDFYSTIAV